MYTNGHTFYATFIVSSLYPKEPLLSPSWTPRVLHDPVRGTIITAIPHNKDHVIGYLPWIELSNSQLSSVVVYASLIEERWRVQWIMS